MDSFIVPIINAVLKCPDFNVVTASVILTMQGLVFVAWYIKNQYKKLTQLIQELAKVQHDIAELKHDIELTEEKKEIQEEILKAKLLELVAHPHNYGRRSTD